MNIKMSINSQLSIIESKKKPLSKQAEQKQNHRYGAHFDGYPLGGGKGRTGEKVQGLRSTNWQVQNRQEDGKNSIRNGVAKELICMTHGHVPRVIAGGTQGNGWREAKG